MRLREKLRRSFARSDMETAWITSAALLLAVFVPGMFLYAYAAEESLEQFDRWFEYTLSVVVREVEDDGVAAIRVESLSGLLPSADAAIRVRGTDGAIVAERGGWPAEDEQIRARLHDGKSRRRDLRVAWWVRHARWMVGEHSLSSGETLEIALPLRSFASVNAKIRLRIAVGAVISAFAVLVIGIGTTMRAFAPLRRATALVREVDTGSLGLRLPNRGTGDAIDQHAETLNSVLARIDEGFARLRAFSSEVAHELRTPLNRMSTVTEVALLKGEERDLRAALEAVHGTTEELARTVQALLLLAEIDERRLALQPSRIPLAAWIPAPRGGLCALVRGGGRRARVAERGSRDRGRSRVARSHHRQPARQCARLCAIGQPRRDPRRAPRGGRRRDGRRRGPRHPGRRLRARVRSLRASGRRGGRRPRPRARARTRDRRAARGYAARHALAARRRPLRAVARAAASGGARLRRV
jgi:signal transduction histidine kinase